jgi:hypothetical protein
MGSEFGFLNWFGGESKGTGHGQWSQKAWVINLQKYQA